jgi:drug/metabolite transporter (DMT)-like permease
MKNKGSIYLALTILFFSTYEVVGRTVAGRIDPLQLNFFRFLFGGLILLPLAISDLKRKEIKLVWKDFVYLLLLGMLQVGVSMNLLQYGINLTKANLAAVIFSANPLFVAVSAALWLGESLNGKKALGLLLGLCGVAITFAGGGQNGGAYYTGVICLVLSALTFGIYTAVGKKITLRVGSLTMNSLCFILGSIALFPVLLVRHLPIFFFQPVVWPQVFYLTVFVTGLAYYSYFLGLSMVDTSLGSMVFFIKPLLASVLAAIFLGEKVSLQLALGTVLVLVSIYIVQHSIKVKVLKHESPTT